MDSFKLRVAHCNNYTYDVFLFLQNDHHLRQFEYPVKRLNLETKICITIPVIDLMVDPKWSIFVS